MIKKIIDGIVWIFFFLSLFLFIFSLYLTYKIDRLCPKICDMVYYERYSEKDLSLFQRMRGSTISPISFDAISLKFHVGIDGIYPNDGGIINLKRTCDCRHGTGYF